MEKDLIQESKVMKNVIQEIKVKEGEIATLTKVHPRMYSIGTLEFQKAPEWSGIDIPVSVKNDILRAIEEAGYSVTYMYDDMVSINAIKKQLQHDA